MLICLHTELTIFNAEVSFLEKLNISRDTVSQNDVGIYRQIVLAHNRHANVWRYSTFPSKLMTQPKFTVGSDCGSGNR